MIRAEAIYFFDLNGSLWQTCDPNNEDAVNFGPTGAAHEADVVQDYKNDAALEGLRFYPGAGR